MANFKIGNLTIGDDFPPVVIAEIGINHEGSIDLALDMADAAIKAGAKIIKHQTHIVEDDMQHHTNLYHKYNLQYKYHQFYI